jgi:hypothetical protein
MESTLLHSFIRSSRLKSWLARSDCPPAVLECKKLFDKATSSQAGDSEHHNSIHGGDLHEHARLAYNGVTYARSSTHLGNSLVQFYLDGHQESTPVAAQIESIFTQGSCKIVSVRRQIPAANNIMDPFRHYPHLQMKIYSSTLTENTELIPMSWILSHVARCPVSPELVVIVSLSRVSRWFLLCCLSHTYPGIM